MENKLKVADALRQAEPVAAPLATAWLRDVAEQFDRGNVPGAQLGATARGIVVIFDPADQSLALVAQGDMSKRDVTFALCQALVKVTDSYGEEAPFIEPTEQFDPRAYLGAEAYPGGVTAQRAGVEEDGHHD